MIKVINKIFNIIYPKRCPFCDKVIESSLSICDSCKNDVAPIFIQRDIFLDEKVHQQVFDYCNLINADYAIVCNGSILYCYKYIEDTDSYEELNSVPD